MIQVLAPDGSVEARPEQAVQAGDRVLVGGGERIGVDGTVESGESPLDTALVTGESLPRAAVPGTAVFAGTINLGQPLIIRVTSVGEATLLAGCVRMMEAAESRRTRYVVLADRVARRYAPVVHTAALLTFLGWYFGAGVPLDQALLTASAVLIITCPCALALAVPAVQVIATSSLLRSGMLLKTATALERLAEADTVVFDKTGTLTEPLPHLVSDGADRAALRVAASLAAASRHPLARALLASSGPVPVAAGVTEQPGAGMRAGDIRLGSASFCGIEAPGGDGPELWLTRPGHTPVRFGFQEQLRPGALETIARLRAMGLAVRLISGDRSEAVSRAAAALGIDDWRAGCSPADKAAAIAAMTAAGHKVLMAGDGLNDGPALASAHVSASPSSGADISQNAADMVFQGRALTPVADAIATARLARRVARSNLIFACGYNLIMVPIAALGWVTPWLAALAMSGSSLAVIVNSFRVRGRRRQ